MPSTYTVAKVAAKLKVHPNTIKRIEKRLKLRVKRDYRNYRVYTEEVVNRLWSYINSEKINIQDDNA